MELFFNIVGLLVAVLITCLWHRRKPRSGIDRKTQLVALALLILILFPVISVTDDLLAAQNIAETDASPRRGHAISSLHPVHPVSAIAAEPRVPESDLGFPRFADLKLHASPRISMPTITKLANRPPPAA